MKTEIPSRPFDRLTLLIVDDEADIRDLLCEQFAALGAKCLTAEDGLDAVAIVESAKPDAILSDIKMPHLDGLDLLRHLRDQGNQTPVVFLTGDDDIDTLISAIRIGAADFHKKPYVRSALVKSVGDALELGRRMNQMEHEYDQLCLQLPQGERQNSEDMKAEYLRLQLERAVFFRKEVA